MIDCWLYKEIGEVFRTYAGGTPSKLDKANYENGTIPWIRSGEVCKKYITESELFITEKGLRNSSAKYYPINTVLVAMYGATAAQSGILKFNATSNQAVCGILPNEEFVPEFVYAYFTYIKEQLAAQAQGGAQPNISQEKIKKVLFPCIPLSEQQRIVGILDAEFEKIDALKANAEKNLQNAKDLLVKTMDILLLPKENWQDSCLCTLCNKIGSGATPSGGKKSYGKEGISLIRSMNVYNNEFRYEDLAHINDKQASLLANVEVSSGDVLFNITGASVTRCCLVPDNVIPARVNQHVSILRVKQDMIIPQFLVFTLISERHNNPLMKMAENGATRQAITKKQLEEWHIQYPTIKEQQDIIIKLNELSDRCNNLQDNYTQTIALCNDLKQALLRKAFSGEL